MTDDRPRRSRAGRRRLGLLICVAAVTSPAAAQQPVAFRTARVSYLTGTAAYIDAGREEGLREGARLEVMRGGATVGVLKVAFLASHQASCEIVSASATLVVGDSVRFVPATLRADSAVAGRPAARPKPTASGAGSMQSRNGYGLRGRLGAHYLVVRQRDSSDSHFSQPSFDVRLDGYALGGTPLGVTVDVRTRRTFATLADGSTVTDGRTRVYQASLFWNALGSPARVTVGRQLSPNLASVNLFDGVMAEVRQPDWSAGLFTGSQPEPLNLGFSSGVVEGGGYLQRHSRPGGASVWSLTFGASGSYQDAKANREFVFLQGAYSSRRLSGFVTQELDYYRSWKRVEGERALSPTSTFATFQYRATGGFTLHVGFDNRRNVRLYRDVVNPETVFDDTYRQGVWAGFSTQFSGRYRVGVDARSSSGGPAGRADAYTLSLGADRVSTLGLSLRSRSTRYTNPQLEGWLHSLALGLEPVSRLRLELTGGLRAERNPLADPTDTRVTWVGADVDVNLARSWYLMLSANRETGGLESNDQLYGGLSVRF